MNELKPNQEGYAHFTVSNKKIERGVTAFVRITNVNGEYLELIDKEEIKYKVPKDKFKFTEI
jgi:hypothetical protein